MSTGPTPSSLIPFETKKYSSIELLMLKLEILNSLYRVSLLRKHGGHSHGQLFSLSLVEAKDG